MNKLIILFFLAINSFALSSKDLNINAGIGFASSRGVVGISADKFLSEHYALSGAIGIDLIGATLNIGGKYFDRSIQKNNPTNTFLDRCFFLFDCDVYPYFGINGIYSVPTSIETITDNQKRSYHVDEMFLGQAVFGFRDIFPSKLTLDLELSYRKKITGGDLYQTAGSYSSEEENNIQRFADSFGFGIALGYLF